MATKEQTEMFQTIIVLLGAVAGVLALFAAFAR
jgi:hypothetical protein